MRLDFQGYVYTNPDTYENAFVSPSKTELFEETIPSVWIWKMCFIYYVLSMHSKCDVSVWLRNFWKKLENASVDWEHFEKKILFLNVL